MHELNSKHIPHTVIANKDLAGKTKFTRIPTLLCIYYNI